MAEPVNHGIVVVGNTAQTATRRYREVATVAGAALAFGSPDNQAFVTHSSARTGLFNPSSGNMDLAESEEALKLHSLSSGDGETREVHHLVCTNSCGAHILADDASFVKFCPSCTASLSESEDDEDQDESEEAAVVAEDAADPVEDEAVDTEEDDSEEGDDTAEDESEDEAEDESEVEVDVLDSESGDCEEDDESESSEDDEDGDTAEDEDDAEDDEDVAVAAESLSAAVALYQKNAAPHRLDSISSSSLSVHYLVCTNSDCATPHVVSDVHLDSCPACSAALTEPSEVPSVIDTEEPVDFSADEDEDEDSEVSLDLDLDSESEDVSDDELAALSGDDLDEDDADLDEDASDDGEVESYSASGLKPRSRVEFQGPSFEEDGEWSLGILISGLVHENIFNPARAKKEGKGRLGYHIAGASGGTVYFVEKDAVRPAKRWSKSSDDLNEDASEDLEEIELNTFDDLTDEMKDEDVLPVSTSAMGEPGWIVFRKGAPIARLLKSHAGSNADLIEDPVIGRSLVMSARNVGLKSALQSLNFQPFTQKVSISANVAAKVEQAVAAAQDSVRASSEEREQRLMAALATAAMGMSRNFFAGVNNPLRERMMSALSSAGLRNPEAVVERVFAESSDAYHKVLLQQAQSILQEPAAVQESLSRAILNTNFTSQSSSESIGAQLSTLGVPPEQREPVQPQRLEAQSSASDWENLLQSATSSLGQRRRG